MRIEGAKFVSPSTNNALEATNRVLTNDENTLRERLPLSRFKEVIFEMVQKYAHKYMIYDT